MGSVRGGVRKMRTQEEETMQSGPHCWQFMSHEVTGYHLKWMEPGLALKRWWGAPTTFRVVVFTGCLAFYCLFVCRVPLKVKWRFYNGPLHKLVVSLGVFSTFPKLCYLLLFGSSFCGMNFCAQLPISELLWCWGAINIALFNNATIVAVNIRLACYMRIFLVQCIL